MSLWNCSPLYKTRVVLRQFLSSQAQRRGKRAIEVCICAIEILHGILRLPICYNLSILFCLVGFEEVSPPQTPLPFLLDASSWLCLFTCK